jgi:ribonucleoside-diphosphate reductase alpha chain
MAKYTQMKRPLIKIESYFVAKGKKASRLFKWTRRDGQIKDAKGNIYFDMKGVEAPKDWSSLAVEIAASKYFRNKKEGQNNSREKSIQDLVHRVTETICKHGVKQKYFSKTDGEIFKQELNYILFKQMASFNSPVWFNCGLSEIYNYKSIPYKKPQVSACFIQSVEDDINSIFDLAKTEAKLFKYGSGSGTNFSALRGIGEPLKGGGASSGLISFLEVLDRGAGSIKSGGTTRRAAKMVILNVDHPEILNFINWKLKEEKKAQALIQAGFDSDYEGEAYRTVSGQNANNSVRVTDTFMKAVLEKKDWHLKSRLDSKKTISKISAQDLWSQLCYAACLCADPGLQFHDNINKWHTCANTDEIKASNPCSEYMFLDDSACNLASLNLTQFLNAKGEFEIEKYEHVARIMFIAQEILVGLAGYPTEKIALNSLEYRPLGLGFAGLGAFLMRQSIAYDDQKGYAWAGALTALLTGVAYRTSAELAQNQGAFVQYKKNKTPMEKVLHQHKNSIQNIEAKLLPENVMEKVIQVWNEVLSLGKKYGYRNAQATVMAPTGTIGLVMDCDTTGIEPDFSLVKNKKLAGGGEVKIISSSLKIGLEKLGYGLEQIQDIQFYVELNGTLEGVRHLKQEHIKIFKTAMELNPEAHLQMMAAIQPFVSGAISKTVNMPRTATPDDVSDVYLKAWQLGLKSVAIYRDGSKLSQPLEQKRIDMPAMPKCFECGSPTELAGGCFRCVNCGTVLGCA